MPGPASDAFERGDPYERYIGRWSRRVAPEFLAWLNEPPGRRWLDVGCGTGALCAAIAESCAPASVIGVEPAEGFLAVARERLGARAALHRGSATAIPLADATVDVVASALVRHAVRMNVGVSVSHLRHGSEILEQLIEEEGVRVVGAVYSLESGVVEFFDGADLG